MSLLSRLAVQAAKAYGSLSSKGGVSANFLVIAGGGSGGSQDNEGGGGGGGAGGFRTSAGTSGGGASAENAIILSTLTTYTITVGAGGAQVGGGVAVAGNDGSNSSISGTGLTTITSTGGGGGACTPTGRSGGSGGGIETATNATNTTGTGISGQGFAGGNIVNNTGYQVGSGGGGAGAVGANGTGSGGAVAGGNGGAGVASSISGSSVTRAGGGGGSADNRISNTLGSGGAGGGGAATNGTGTRATAGTANTGGGGGGSGGAGSGAGGSGVVIISYASATPKFVGGTLTTSGGNQIHTFTSSGTLSPLTPVTASYLVVAGGGGAGAANGGGGGAGGLLTSSTTLYSGATYVVTVGAGGGGGAHATGTGATNGSNSVLSGTGITTVTSTGGGRGGSYAEAAAAGGSGGGASNGTNTGGAGTSGQGNAGGSTTSTQSGNYPAAGGGGAGAAGANVSGGGSNASDGGVGLTSSITGTSTYYAGGGGGGANGGSNSSGGLGGGGAGAVNNPGASGTPNTGGGGGGSAASNNGASGGSGVVIISYAGSQVFNGGLVTSSGGNTIHTFNATGALTPLTNNLNNSLRFRSSASGYLLRTPSVTGNQKTWTWSSWVKRGTLSGGTQFGRIMSTQGAFGVGINFMTDDTLRLYFGGSSTLQTTQVFRDPSAWYHVVVALDTTQATAANRVKLYINGTQVTAFSSATYPNQNDTFGWNNGSIVHQIGASTGDGATAYLDGYQTDINAVDGQALEPYYFGNNDANQVWKPILYKGTYGTNGFYLTFADTSALTTSSNAGLGKDTSGNGNYWATNNISITAGTTYDAMTDVPTNTSATVANYCVLNPLVASTTATITNANLNATGSTTTFANARATFTLSSEKWYWEHTITGSSTLDIGIGLCTEASQKSSATNIRQTGWYNVINGGPGDISSSANGGASVSISTTNWATNDIIMVAYDAGTGYIWFGRNGTWYPPTTAGSAGNPAAGTNQTISAVSNLIPASWHYNTTAGTAVNFGQRPFSYTPPTGFVALNTYNLPTPTILQGNLYMDATLWTGNGPASQIIVNQAQFKPDLMWTKSRSVNGYYHVLIDSVRGITKALYSNATDAENTLATRITSINNNGYTVGSSGDVNDNAQTFVGWQWQAGQGSTSSGTGTGGITSVTQSVNATAGFSIVTYTGSGSNGTVTHGLGVAPKMLLIKKRSGADGWAVGHSSLSSYASVLQINSTAAAFTDTSFFNSTAPTSSVFSVGSGGNTNASAATYVAYCWAEIAGFSKFGSYTGNGNADGPFVYLGFRPKFILFKVSSTTNGWVIYDTVRDTYNYMGSQLYPNLSNAEAVSSSYAIDATSNGFKVRTSNGVVNDSGQTFIYAAFAEHPFKNSNAR